MEPVSSVNVKRLVSEDLKKRKITLTQIAKDLGLTRQTIAVLLSSESYFSVKYASYFSLTYGYSRDFLLKGEGRLFPDVSDFYKDELIKGQEAVIELYNKAAKLGDAIIEIALQNGSNLPEVLLQKAQNMFTYVKLMKAAVRGGVRPYDTASIELVTLSLVPVFEELAHYIAEEYGYNEDRLLR